MKKAYLLGIITILLNSCSTKQENGLNYIIQRFNESSDQIQKLEFSSQRIDTSAQGGVVWNNTGFALIEKAKGDEVFGFSFYGKRDDIPKEYLYQEGILFEISDADSSYETEIGGLNVLGKPGGQMIPKNIFHLDSTYSSISFTANDREGFIFRQVYSTISL